LQQAKLRLIAHPPPAQTAIAGKHISCQSDRDCLGIYQVSKNALDSVTSIA